MAGLVCVRSCAVGTHLFFRWAVISIVPMLLAIIAPHVGDFAVVVGWLVVLGLTAL